jgi:hypothetical protein
MGLNAAGAALLVEAKQKGARFTDTVTVGRMGLAVSRRELAAHCRALGAGNGDRDDMASDLARDRFADRFFRELLGAASLRVIDYSPYQRADIVHDMNQPLPETLHESCDVLFDGGSMEHIFDVKQVLTNYMKLVRPNGGRIFINVPANNLFGHGFYQFSPELFFRVFSAENGFMVHDIYVIESSLLNVEMARDWRCYRTADPAEAGRRIRLVNGKPLMLFVHAERVKAGEPFAQPPMQSDYKARWERVQTAHQADAVFDEANAKPFEYLTRWQALRQGFKQRRKHSLKNRRFFHAVRLSSDEDL